MQGVLACLRVRVDGLAYAGCPYAEGTSEADAYFAGIQEGREISPIGSACAGFEDQKTVTFVGDVEQFRADWMRSTNVPARITACQATTLPVVVNLLRAEHAQVDAELGAMKVSEWESPRCKALVNREQELRTTLTVLRGLTQQPVQITEPAQ